jgi:hypothetical protein
MTSSLCGFSILSLVLSALSLSTRFSGVFLSFDDILGEGEGASISILTWLWSSEAGNCMEGCDSNFYLPEDGVDEVGLFPFQVLFCCGNGSGNVSSEAIVTQVIYEVLEYPVQEVGYPDDKQVVGCLHVLERRSVGF